MQDTLKASERGLYAQKSQTAQYGIIQSQYASENNREMDRVWSTESRAQDLTAQLPKSGNAVRVAGDNGPRVSLSQEYKFKMVHEWNESDVSSWLRAVLSSSSSDHTVNSYVWAFHQSRINGKCLITMFARPQDIVNKVQFDSVATDDIDDDMIRAIFDGITTLKQRAKKEINDLHPMKQSMLDAELRTHYKHSTFHSSSGDDPAAAAQQQPRCCYVCDCLCLVKLTNYRYYRISLLCVTLFIFCALQTIEFVARTNDTTDYGGLIAMVLFLVATVAVLVTLCKEASRQDVRMHTNYEHLSSANDSDNEIEYDHEYEMELELQQSAHSPQQQQQLKQLQRSHKDKEWRFVVECQHVLAIVCVLLGGVVFITSRWLVLDAKHLSQWLYGCGVGCFIAGLCVLLAIDIACLRLMDDQRRRMLALYSLNLCFYAFVVGSYALIENDWNTISLNVVLGLLAIAGAVVSVAVLVVLASHRRTVLFHKTRIKIVLPFLIVSTYIATVLLLCLEFHGKFYPIPISSVSGSMAFILLSTVFTVLITIDSRIFIL